ncbi:MAG: hypothetical protein SVU69_02940 [Pseudomonadota bacterium]|nr:hypothetical protein [Pseudomonadota bacterium]
MKGLRAAWVVGMLMVLTACMMAPPRSAPPAHETSPAQPEKPAKAISHKGPEFAAEELIVLYRDVLLLETGAAVELYRAQTRFGLPTDCSREAFMVAMLLTRADVVAQAPPRGAGLLRACQMPGEVLSPGVAELVSILQSLKRRAAYDVTREQQLLDLIEQQKQQIEALKDIERRIQTRDRSQP